MFILTEQCCLTEVVLRNSAGKQMCLCLEKAQSLLIRVEHMYVRLRLVYKTGRNRQKDCFVFWVSPGVFVHTAAEL